MYTSLLTKAQHRSLPLTLVGLLGLIALMASHLLITPNAMPVPAIDLDFGQLPLSFVPHARQTNSAVQFQVHDMGGTIFFTPNETVLALPSPGQSPSAIARLRFEGANPDPAIAGLDRLPGVVNYFIGDDPAAWRTNVPTYAAIVYQQLYPGIDLRYDGTSGQLKGAYLIAPGADPSLIRWHYDGATGIHLDEPAGNLLIDLSGSTLIERNPTAWQEIDGQRVPIAISYELAGNGSIGFALASYDTTRPLIIDPTLVYSTYLGGNDFEEVRDIALDGDGNAYIAGNTSSTNFPTQNPLQDSHAGGNQDAFVTKINAAGDALVYSTYLGGNQMDRADGIAVSSDGSVYITGDTGSTNFPTHNPLQSRGGLSDAFVARLNASGNALVYSTYLGGSQIDEGEDIALDSDGNAYVTGTTFSGSLFSGGFGGDGDAFAAKLSADGSTLIYGIYLGGSDYDFGMGIQVDSSGNAYVLGQTFSDDLPTENPLQAAYAGSGDLFVSKLNSNGSDLLYSTYLGGSESDYSYGIALDSTRHVYVTGQTESTDFPTTGGAFDTTCGTDGDCDDDGSFYTYGDAFAAKLNTSGDALLYSTYLGGSGLDKGFAIAVDSAGNAYLTGDTDSDDFPTLDSLQPYRGDTDAFVLKLNNNGSDLLYSTYLGGDSSDYGTGIAVDDANNAFVVGITFSEDLPTENPLQDTHGGGYADAFVVKISDTSSPPTETPTSTPTGVTPTPTPTSTDDNPPPPPPPPPPHPPPATPLPPHPHPPTKPPHPHPHPPTPTPMTTNCAALTKSPLNTRSLPAKR